MKPQLFCYAEGQRSTVVKETLTGLRNLFPVITDEQQAVLNEKTVIIQFINSLKPEEVIRIIKKRRRMYPNHLLMCIGPGARLELKFELFKAGLDEYLNFYMDLALICQKIYHSCNNFHENTKPKLLKVGNLSLDPAKGIVKRKGKQISLRNKELDLLTYLMKRNNQVCSMPELLEEVWGYNYQVVSNTVQTHMATLRKKIDKGFQHKLLHTLPKQGYVLAEHVAN